LLSPCTDTGKTTLVTAPAAFLTAEARAALIDATA
jgi:hypothetical protein